MERKVISFWLFVVSFSFSFATEDIEADPTEELEELQENLQDETNALRACVDRSRHWCRTFSRRCSHPFVSSYCPKTCGRCSVAGGWSSWSAYGPCSKTCSYGYQTRSRKCNNPVFGKNACQGPSEEQQNCNEHVTCPGDVGALTAAVMVRSEGTWTAWGQYSQCSKSCGEGIQSRIRKCVNPSHPFGHKTCKGAFRQRRPCNMHPCPIDGNWTPWGQYGSCSKSCGGGVQYKYRKCKNPPPKHGGKYCVGPSVLSRECNTQACRVPAVDGQWSPWGLYSQCTKSCSGGSQYRTRICDNPAPSGGGKQCSGPSTETKACNTQGCPVDGHWGPWSMFGGCTKSCGFGKKYRNRKCDSPPPANGGQNCQGPSFEVQSCNTHPCAVDGHWSPWGQFSQCSKSCGGGSQYRTRTCDNPAPSGGGQQCSGPAQETRHCNTQACAVDGQWSQWSVFGQCSVTCGGGFKHRSRKCDNPAPANGGKTCQGSSFQSIECNVQTCPVDGQWSQWSVFGQCSVSCGGGYKLRIRKCDNPAPANGGKSCQGQSFQSIGCNTPACSVDGQWSPWGMYGGCSVTCGGGSQYRNRKCDNPAPVHGGADCVGPSQQSRSCNSQACKIDGKWSPWGMYGGCSVTCEGGSQYRNRKCDNPAPAHGGADCVGPNQQSRSCSSQACKIDGQWSPWSMYGGCSVTCGGGLQYRNRKCDNPAPAHGGVDCVGPNQQSRSCNSQPCKIDGQWSPWGVYGRCSVTCGGGSQSRNRKCDNPAPANGGADCVGPSQQSRRCNSQPCEIETNWSPWSTYGPCNKACGGGSQYRVRECKCKCDNPPYAYNAGGSCAGPSRQSRRCNAQPCKVNGGWSSWGPYSKCSRTCGAGGRQTRKRTCTNPAPSYGGRSCRGFSQETRRCGSRTPCALTCRDTKSYDFCKSVLMSYRCGQYYRSCRKTCGSCNYKY